MHQGVVRLWVDARDKVLGWLFIYPSAGMFDIVVHPVVSGTELEAQMLDDVEQYLTSLT
jgi:hypothetical protein